MKPGASTSSFSISPTSKTSSSTARATASTARCAMASAVRCRIRLLKRRTRRAPLPEESFPSIPLTAGISNKLLGACVRQALAACAGNLPDILPASVQQQYDLCPARFAYETVHLPSSFDDLQKARRRLVFEEFFVFSAGLAAIRTQREALHTKAMDTQHMEPFYRLLPFRLTNAQQAAIDDILRDLSSCRPMNRLVQGDVGSGKTMVAAAACFCAIQNGHQAAFMAPTEILAEQHAQSLSRLFSPLGIHVTLLTGSMTAAQKRAAKSAITSGAAQLIIGTHALFTRELQFHDLALVVCDEQDTASASRRERRSLQREIPPTCWSCLPRRFRARLRSLLTETSMCRSSPSCRRAGLPVETFLIGEDKRTQPQCLHRQAVRCRSSGLHRLPRGGAVRAGRP